jgi:RNA polymerase sigma-70 factor (ECF subfamily)
VTVVGNSRIGIGHEQEMESSDASLWARSRAGDTEAFGLLFERHAKAMYNYCFRRLGSWAAAEDILSVVLLEDCRRRE